MSVKSVFKELTIFILLTAIVIMVLIVVFTEFIPTEEEPTTITYVPESHVKATLEEVTTTTGGETENTTSLLKSYEVNKSDLKVYQSSKSYDSGKVNPFVELEKDEFENEVEPTLGSAGSGNTTKNTVAGSTSSSSSSGSSSTGTFFEGSTK